MPVRVPAYEASSKVVFKKFGIDLLPFKDVTCCGAQFVESLSQAAFAAMGGRILALAEKQGKDICAICGACSGSLSHNKHLLDTNKALRDEVNALLAEEDLEYTGKVRVKHILRVLKEEVGYSKLGKAIRNPYDGIPIAAHYGCHVTRPPEIVQVDDPEHPTIIDKVIEIAGATPTDYVGKTRCCGGPMLAMDEELATKIGLEKINNMKAAGAKGVVTACVFCDIQLTQVQLGIEDPTARIPTITLPQFLGVAMGINQDTLGVYLNKIDPTPVFSTAGGK